MAKAPARGACKSGAVLFISTDRTAMGTTPRQKTTAKKSGAAAAPALALEREQSHLFDDAIAEFRAGRYSQARELFQAAAGGPNPGMTHSARLHVLMCEQRLGAGQVSLQTPDELYNYSIALINSRRLSEAEERLRQAAVLAPAADHIYYALALCLALRGDLHGAHANLKRAIEIDPRNRVAARNDPDFAEAGQLPPLAELLYAGSTRG
jgi:Flp pilus assembly protein TadD